MEQPKKLWRALLFVFLLSALCGSFAIPVESVPVNAAPRMQKATNIVISEFRTRGPSGGNDEFIELYNPSNSPVDISGWLIRGSNNTGTTVNTRATIPSSTVLGPGQYYLIANTASNGYSGTVSPNLTYSSGISDDGGLALTLADTTIIDQVGLSNGSAYKEGLPLSPLTGSVEQSYERKIGGNSGNCNDTNNNLSDYFLNQTSSNPQNFSSPAVLCREWVTNVTATNVDATYASGDVIGITITFSGTVDVTGTPTVLLETGNTDRTANYVSGSGSDTLTFNYEVMTGDSSNDLDYVSNIALALNGGTITSITGDAVLTLPAPGSPGSLGANKDIVIDNGVPPSITVSKASGQADTATTLPISFTVVFSEAINPATFEPTDITQNGTANVTTWAVSNSGDNITFTVSATAITGTGTVIPSIAAGRVMDAAGNGNIASVFAGNSVTYSPATSSAIVISEFRTRGPNGANDEFIEIYNPTTSPVDISGWKINASNDSGTVDTRVTIPASTILRSGQYYLIVNNNSNGGYSNTNVPGDLTYGTGITNGGGIAILRPDNTVVDRAGMGANSAYKEGNPLAPLSEDANRSYERKIGGEKDSCQDTGDNANDFTRISPSNPKNYLSALSLCGVLQPTPVTTTTTITAHSPNPSLVNRNVTVSVSVTVPFGSSIPTGKVNVTSTNTSCSINLTSASAGRGSCNIIFSTLGTKTITATYLGDNLHLKSSDTETHLVSTSTALTPTRVPTPIPPPPLVAINEFVPRPGRDWNNDGVVDVGDEFIELLNHGTVDVNLSGWSLDDEVNIGSTPYRLPALVLRPGERAVFYGSETGLLLSDGGDGVRLLRPNGQLMDAYNYSVVRFPDQSFCRLPDNGGADDWNQSCYPTPGLQNSLSGGVSRPPAPGREDLFCPIADTLPDDFARAECDPYGHDIWRAEYWDRTGWYGERILPGLDGKWPVFAD